MPLGYEADAMRLIDGYFEPESVDGGVFIIPSARLGMPFKDDE